MELGLQIGHQHMQLLLSKWTLLGAIPQYLKMPYQPSGYLLLHFDPEIKNLLQFRYQLHFDLHYKSLMLLYAGNAISKSSDIPPQSPQNVNRSSGRPWNVGDCCAGRLDLWASRISDILSLLLAKWNEGRFGIRSRKCSLRFRRERIGRLLETEVSLWRNRWSNSYPAYLCMKYE